MLDNRSFNSEHPLARTISTLPPEDVTFLVPATICSFVALISWGSWRFREPGDLGLIALSVLFLWSLFVNPKHLVGPTSSGFS
jgi:hypothetical protein